MQSVRDQPRRQFVADGRDSLQLSQRHFAAEHTRGVEILLLRNVRGGFAGKSNDQLPDAGVDVHPMQGTLAAYRRACNNIPYEDRMQKLHPAKTQAFVGEDRVRI